MHVCHADAGCTTLSSSGRTDADVSFASSRELASLEKKLQHMNVKFQQAEDWVEEVASRVTRIELLLFRSSISSFVQIDKAIDEVLHRADCTGLKSTGLNAQGNHTSAAHHSLEATQLSLHSVLSAAPDLSLPEDTVATASVTREEHKASDNEISASLRSLDSSLLTCSRHSKSARDTMASLVTKSRQTDTTSTISTCTSLRSRVESLQIDGGYPSQNDHGENSRHYIGTPRADAILSASMDFGDDGIEAAAKDQGPPLDFDEAFEAFSRQENCLANVPVEANGLNKIKTSCFPGSYNAFDITDAHASSEKRQAIRNNCPSLVLEECTSEDKEDTFPELFQWSTQHLMSDPSWTEPVPRDLDLSQSQDISWSNGSMSMTCGSVNDCGIESKQMPVVDCDMVVAARTPSPERQFYAPDPHIDERGCMIAHLIAENAKLHADLQALSEARATQHDCSHSSIQSGELQCLETTFRSSNDALLNGCRLQTKVKSRKPSKKERERRQKHLAAVCSSTAPNPS